MSSTNCLWVVGKIWWKYRVWLIWLINFRKYEPTSAHFSARLARASSAQLSSRFWNLLPARLSSAHQIRQNSSSAQLIILKNSARSTSRSEQISLKEVKGNKKYFLTHIPMYLTEKPQNGCQTLKSTRVFLMSTYKNAKKQKMSNLALLYLDG